jgi:hypothetical protein
MKLHLYSLFAIACLVAGSGVDLFAQGSLTPPGPTMKSLDQSRLERRSHPCIYH